MNIGGTPGKVSRPKVQNMLIFASRHKTSTEDNDFTYQFPLLSIGLQSDINGNPYDPLRKNVLADLSSMLEAHLCVSLTEMSIVWCQVDSGQVAVVKDSGTLCAAVMDHQNAGKHTIQLYVVKKFGKPKAEGEYNSSGS